MRQPTLESAAWFLSEDGHQAYLAADTLGAKVRYFWDYLREICERGRCINERLKSGSRRAEQRKHLNKE